MDRTSAGVTTRITSASRARLLGAVLLGACLLAPGVASAAKVKGKVANYHYLVNPVWAEAKDPKKRGYTFREAVPTVPAKFRKLFPHIPKELCIAALAKTPQKPPKPILIRVGGGRATPVTIVVPPMTQFQFKNTDPFTHKLFGVKIKTFSVAETLKGAARDWTVPTAGSFEIRDKRAPSLRMWIVAEKNVASIAYPSMKGEFRLDIKEPGEYDIQAYFAGKKVGPAKAITIDKRDLDISKDVIKVAKAPPKKKSAAADKKSK